MRALRLAVLTKSGGKLTVPATWHQRLRSISLFALLSGAMWHHFCYVCLRYLTFGTP